MNIRVCLKVTLLICNSVFFVLGILIIIPAIMSLANHETRKIIDDFSFNYISAFMTIGFFMLVAAVAGFGSIIGNTRRVYLVTVGFMVLLFCIEILFIAHLHSTINEMKTPKPPIGQKPQEGSDLFTDLRGLALMGKKGGQLCSYFFDALIIIEFPWLIIVLALLFLRKSKTENISVSDTQVIQTEEPEKKIQKLGRAMKRGGKAVLDVKRRFSKPIKIEVHPRGKFGKVSIEHVPPKGEQGGQRMKSAMGKLRFWNRNSGD